MSPLRTQRFHQLCNRHHLGTIILVGLQRCYFGRQFGAAPESTSRIDEGGPNRRGSTQARGFKRSKRPFCLLVEPYGYRLGHTRRLYHVMRYTGPSTPPQWRLRQSVEASFGGEPRPITVVVASMLDLVDRLVRRNGSWTIDPDTGLQRVAEFTDDGSCERPPIG